MEPETKASDQPPKEAMDQRTRNTAAGELKVKEVEADVFLAHHPCSSLLQLLLRACAGCLGLHGYCNDDDYLKPPAAANDDAAAPAVAEAETPKEGAGGGEAASYLQEARTRMRKSPSPPDTPRGGSGDDGGKHH